MDINTDSLIAAAIQRGYHPLDTNMYSLRVWLWSKHSIAVYTDCVDFTTTLGFRYHVKYKDGEDWIDKVGSENYHLPDTAIYLGLMLAITLLDQ